MGPTSETNAIRKGDDLYAIEWPFLALDDDWEMVQGKVRNRLIPLFRDLARFRGLLLMVRGGTKFSRYDRDTGEKVSFDCCRVNCLALWDGEAGMLRASLTNPFRAFRDELGKTVVQAERKSRYEVVYRALPEGVGGETGVYGTITEAKVQLENLDIAIGRTVSTVVVPVLAAEPGFRGALVLRSYDDLADVKRHREAPGLCREPGRFARSGAGRRRDARAYQHWCVSLGETLKHMEESNDLVWRSTVRELSDLISRGWWVDRTDHEGAFLP